MSKFSDIVNINITPDSEFAHLDRELHIHGGLMFSECELPLECIPSCTALIFIYADGNYRIRFQDPISYSGSDIGFSTLCREQEMTFQSMDEMKSFLRNMEITSQVNNRYERTEGNHMQARTMPTTERQQLNLNRNNAHKGKKLNAERLFQDMTTIVRGQDEAVKVVTHYACACAAKVNPIRPISIFVSGPTGTGKSLMGTSLAYALNQQITDTQMHYDTILVHCNEMREDHQVSRLIGPPGGYVGYGDETLLSPIASNPYHVVIFDEIEKASPKVLDVLMRALDSGEIMLAKPVDGKTKLDMKHCILIFTSNIPLEALRQRPSVGFQAPAAHDLPILPVSRMAMVKQYRDVLVESGIRREIVARFTDIIQFEHLQGDAVVDIILQSIQQCAAQFDLTISYVAPEIAQAIYDQAEMQYGARMANCLIEQTLSLCFAQEAGNNTDASYDLLGTLEYPKLCVHKKETPLEEPPKMIPDVAEPSSAETAEDETDLFDWEQDC